jgi:hypothetical protein
MPNPQLVSIAVEGSAYIAVDSAGQVWQGRIVTGQRGDKYIDWKPLDSEFPRGPGDARRHPCPIPARHALLPVQHAGACPPLA